MSMEWRTELGSVTVANEVIQRLAGAAAMGSDGLVGMASRAQLKDGLAELVGLENLARGVEVRNVEGSVSIDLYIIVQYGKNVSDVAKNIQDLVFTSLHRLIGLTVSNVNVYVQGVRLPVKEQPVKEQPEV